MKTTLLANDKSFEYTVITKGDVSGDKHLAAVLDLQKRQVEMTFQAVGLTAEAGALSFQDSLKQREAELKEWINQQSLIIATVRDLVIAMVAYEPYCDMPGDDPRKAYMIRGSYTLTEFRNNGVNRVMKDTVYQALEGRPLIGITKNAIVEGQFLRKGFQEVPISLFPKVAARTTHPEQWKLFLKDPHWEDEKADAVQNVDI